MIVAKAIKFWHTKIHVHFSPPRRAWHRYLQYWQFLHLTEKEAVVSPSKRGILDKEYSKFGLDPYLCASIPLVGQRFVVLRCLLERGLCLAAWALLACFKVGRCRSSTGEGREERDGDYLGEIHFWVAGGPKEIERCVVYIGSSENADLDTVVQVNRLQYL